MKRLSWKLTSVAIALTFCSALSFAGEASMSRNQVSGETTKVTTKVRQQHVGAPTALNTGIPAPATPSGTGGIIQEIDMTGNQVASTFRNAGQVQPGDRLVVNLPKSGQCFLTVRSVSKNTVVSDSSQCAAAQELKAGQVVEKSLFTTADTSLNAPSNVTTSTSASTSTNTALPVASGETTKSVEVSETHITAPVQKTGLEVYLLYSMADSVDSNVTTGNNQGTFSDRSNGTLGLGIESVMFREREIGYSAGFSFDFNRTLETVGGATPTRSNPTLNFILPYLNANVLINRTFFALGGLNYSFPTIGSTAYTGNGRVGYQVGIGLIAGDSLGIQLLYRSVNTRAVAPGSSINMNVAGLVLNAGYYF